MARYYRRRHSVAWWLLIGWWWAPIEAVLLWEGLRLAGRLSR